MKALDELRVVHRGVEPGRDPLPRPLPGLRQAGPPRQLAYDVRYLLDGGVVGWNVVKAIDTYSIQNHGIIKELYRRHGRDLNFVGVIGVCANTEPASRIRCAFMAASLVKNVLGADGVILAKVTGGMPHIDLAVAGEECEKLGVKTAIVSVGPKREETIVLEDLFR